MGLTIELSEDFNFVKLNQKGSKNMANKKIMQCFILILIVSLTCAAIYATEAGEVSHSDSSNKLADLHISESINVSHVLSSANQIQHDNGNLTPIHL